jgi:predicted TPR repeat methyltransferase
MGSSGSAGVVPYAANQSISRSVTSNDFDEAALERAIALSKAEHFFDAEPLLRTFLRRYPTHPRALEHLGILLAQTGRDEKSVRYMRQAINRGARAARTFYNLGTVLKRLRSPLEALDAFNSALAMEPTNAAIWNNRGTVFSALGRHQEAMADFDKATALQADFAGALYNKAYSLRLLGRHAESAAIFDRALLAKPELAEAWVERQQLEQTPHALRRSRRPFERGVAEAWVACGNVLYHYQSLASARPALTAYERALNIKSDLAEACLGQGNIFNLLARNQEALAAYDRALAIEPELAEAWLGRARALQDLERLDEAIVAYRSARERGSDAELIQCALAALGAEAAPPIAPRGLVIDLYERYADQYDQHVTRSLKYRTSDLLFDALTRFMPRADLDVLDLGCGTGLFGKLLRSRARTLTGIDISPNMLKVASDRKIYDKLFCADLVEFLQTQAEAFDLAAAADVFCYIGDLSGVFHTVRDALRAGGYFCFSVEAGNDNDYVLGTTLRYRHSAAYLRNLATSQGFALEMIEPQVTRQDTGQDVASHLAVLRRA